MELKRIAMSPWDFTLYESNDDALVLKVMFSEGEVKSDIGRYFIVDSFDRSCRHIEELRALAARIRADYPNVPFPQVDKASLNFR
ncbi:hypothetical protein [Mycolicibacterium houstonense]|uniref:hypothetical protein n=1 Tax=Mycolicibacterium houstonense TaxID=146021 RepID=UPI00082BC0A0|nr:hypothetical protein [Mycolicibacterium houstonense]